MTYRDDLVIVCRNIHGLLHHFDFQVQRSEARHSFIYDNCTIPLPWTDEESSSSWKILVGLGSQVSFPRLLFIICCLNIIVFATSRLILAPIRSVIVGSIGTIVTGVGTRTRTTAIAVCPGIARIIIRLEGRNIVILTPPYKKNIKLKLRQALSVSCHALTKLI